MENVSELITTNLTAILGLIFGLVIGFNFKKSGKKSILSGADDEVKLENEVLQDRVKQLEAKIKTLEKAIQISS